MINMKKLNNKGFSLVELIIVIAIMAILIGVVGTQVIPYLENSRKAKDNQVFSSWNTAGMSAYTSSAGNLNGETNYYIRVAVADGGAMTLTCGTYSGAVTNGAAATENDKTADLRLDDVFDELTKVTTTATLKDLMASKEGKNFTGNVTIWIPCQGAIFTTIGADATKWETIYNK
jgi:prepilin-type N-terminal cleavage/methylation domain-containing protein